MPWIDEALEILSRSPVCGYTARAAGASEPTALAALALVGHTRQNKLSALPATDFLAEIQGADGAVGVRRGADSPRWPTSLAILAWLAVDAQKYALPLEKAITWALVNEGQRMTSTNTGHNSMLAAWAWVEGTHSWVEPSAFFTLALKAANLNEHARTREAVTLLLDRLLLDGGCNYGNTAVLGQMLRPHVQPSGIALLALVDEFDEKRKIVKTLDYLSAEISPETTSCSLAWGILGLAAHDRAPANAARLLEQSFARILKSDRSPHKIALIALAALGKSAPLRIGRKITSPLSLANLDTLAAQTSEPEALAPGGLRALTLPAR